MARLFVVVFVTCLIATVASAQTTTVISTSPIAQTAPATVSAPVSVTTTTSPYRPLGANAPAPTVQPALPPSGGLNKVFNDADLNRDNAVSREEFLSEAGRQFGLADHNKDGRITRDEMQAKQNQVLQNALGNGNWQQQIQGFIGGGAPAPAPHLTAPTVPVVTPPTPPLAPRTY